MLHQPPEIGKNVRQRRETNKKGKGERQERQTRKAKKRDRQERQIRKAKIEVVMKDRLTQRRRR